MSTKFSVIFDVNETKGDVSLFFFVVPKQKKQQYSFSPLAASYPSECTISMVNGKAIRFFYKVTNSGR